MHDHDPTPWTPTRTDLELWALGELPADREAQLEQLCREDPQLAARCDRVREDIALAVLDLPPLDLDAVTQPTLWERLHRWFLGPTGVSLGGLAVAMAALLVVWPATPPDAVVFRGGFDLDLVRIRLGEAEASNGITTVQSGDRLQWTVRVNKPGRLYVYDVQEDQVVSAFVDGVQVRPDQPHTSGAVLDNYAGLERLFFLVADHPVTVDDVKDALERSWATPLTDVEALPGLGDDVGQRSVLLLKGQP